MVKHFNWYPGDDEKKHFARKGKVSKPTHLRKGLKPGTIVILLAGRFRGRRAVFLKQLPSGLLLVTGPYKVNGVPLKRVSQAYVIPTAKTIELKDVAQSINDEYFKKEKEANKEKKYFKEEKDRVVPQAKKDTQKSVDKEIISQLPKNSVECRYMQARFTLRCGMRPHEMKF